MFLLCKCYKTLESTYCDFINVLVEYLIKNTLLFSLYTFGILWDDTSVILGNIYIKKVFKIYHKLLPTFFISILSPLTETISFSLQSNTEIIQLLFLFMLY